MAGQVVSSKRRAIADSGRQMFIWVAAMSAVVGVCIVLAIFLSQQIAFKAKVVGKMTETANTLRENNRVANELIQNVVVKETNTALNTVKASSDEKALQVVLDALPADRNALSLGASLQQSLLSGVDGLTIDSIVVDNAAVAGDTTDSAESNTIPIQIQVSADNASTIKDMLVKFERSIRVIDIDNFVLEKGDTRYQATIQAHAYYQPAKEVTLTETTIKPGSGK